jgi:hypothetical protein
MKSCRARTLGEQRAQPLTQGSRVSVGSSPQEASLPVTTSWHPRERAHGQRAQDDYAPIDRSGWRRLRSLQRYSAASRQSE